MGGVPSYGQSRGSGGGGIASDAAAAAEAEVPAVAAGTVSIHAVVDWCPLSLIHIVSRSFTHSLSLNYSHSPQRPDLVRAHTYTLLATQYMVRARVGNLAAGFSGVHGTSTTAREHEEKIRPVDFLGIYSTTH